MRTAAFFTFFDFARELMSTILAEIEVEINALIEPKLHRASHEILYRLQVVLQLIFDILNAAAGTEVVHWLLDILLLNWRYVFADAAVERIRRIFMIRDILYDAVLLSELLDLQMAQRLGWRAVYRVEDVVFLLYARDVFVYVLHYGYGP